MQIAFFEGVSLYVNKFNMILDGVGIDIMTEDVGGSRIRYIFNRKWKNSEWWWIEVFREKMEELEYAKEVPEKGRMNR